MAKQDDEDPNLFENLQPKRSSWTPPSGENKVLDKVIEKCCHDIEPHLKSNIKSKPNLTHNEKFASKKKTQIQP